MLKVVAIVDKEGTALDRLAKGVSKYHTNLDYSVVAVHPKRPDPQQLAILAAHANTADILDFQYFRTAEKVLEQFPHYQDKKLILTHNNPYSIYEYKWERYDMVVANNQTMKQNLEEHAERDIEHIPLAADTDQWTFNTEWQPSKRILMVANRIEGKKGIAPVAQACSELGLQFVLVGNVSDRNYFYEVMQAGGSIEFNENVTDDELRTLYHSAALTVCNSIDNFESGTLPILESMLCGTPVLTRNVGHVPDLFNGENLKINESDPEDVDNLKKLISALLSDPKALEAQRQSAWNTAKNFNFERRAYLYQKLYRAVLSDFEAVSVVMPVSDRPDVMRKAMNAVAAQDWPNLELIICDDAGTNKEVVDDFAKTVSFPVRYIDVASGDSYGLARARNHGIIEATGETVVFCDERMVMEPDAISKFMANAEFNTWLYGDKNTSKKDFVENFSAIKRQDIINMGMFNERIDRYGGMSQEIRARAKVQGVKNKYVPEAKAIPGAKSSNRNRKRQDIIAMKNLLFKVNL